jgi:hypothetical protein
VLRALAAKAWAKAAMALMIASALPGNDRCPIRMQKPFPDLPEIITEPA